jgi:predicted dehydrogenase
MINVGIIGIGFMGMTHYRAYQKVRGAKVVAIAETDRRRLAGDWRSIKGNFGPAGTKMDLKGVAPYEDWRQMLTDPNVDMVDICLPPAQHAPAAIAALKAGKPVLCEKPIAVAADDAVQMVKAAEKSGQPLMIGHVLQFYPEYAFARNLVESGRYGRLLGGHFKRIISDPLWLKDFYDPVRVGGPVVDLHIHDAHFIRLLCGMPRAVFSTGRMQGDVVKFLSSQFLFDRPDLSVTAASGVVDQQGRSFTHAFEIYLERATLLYDSAVLAGEGVTLMPLSVLTPDGKVKRPKLKPVDAFVAELTEATGAVAAGRPTTLLGCQLARDALVLCHKQSQSVRQGRLVNV